MKDYFYELKYKNGEQDIVYKFNADIQIEDLIEHTKSFLLACGWNKELLSNIFNENYND